MSLSSTAAASLAAALLLLLLLPAPVCRRCMAHLIRPDRGRGPCVCRRECIISVGSAAAVRQQRCHAGRLVAQCKFTDDVQQASHIAMSARTRQRMLPKA
jgi:hypothetical protein